MEPDYLTIKYNLSIKSTEQLNIHMCHSNKLCNEVCSVCKGVTCYRMTYGIRGGHLYAPNIYPVDDGTYAIFYKKKTIS